jgi:hypothetical protein
MNSSIKTFILILLLGCSAAAVHPQAIIQVERTVKSETNADEKLVDLIRQHAGAGNVRYYFNRVDLNGDGEPDVIVFLFGENQCGTGGCHALILEKKKSKYRVVNSYSVTHNPIVVSTEKTNGWHDLLFSESGVGGLFVLSYQLSVLNYLRVDGDVGCVGELAVVDGGYLGLRGHFGLNRSKALYSRPLEG